MAKPWSIPGKKLRSKLKLDLRMLCFPRDAISSVVKEGSGKIFSLPEMLFDQNRVVLQHEASGVSIELNAEDALRAWRESDTGTPLQVSVAKVRALQCTLYG
jgi:hypothetical protein